MNRRAQNKRKRTAKSTPADRKQYTIRPPEGGIRTSDVGVVSWSLEPKRRGRQFDPRTRKIIAAEARRRLDGIPTQRALVEQFFPELGYLEAKRKYEQVVSNHRAKIRKEMEHIEQSRAGLDLTPRPGF